MYLKFLVFLYRYFLFIFFVIFYVNIYSLATEIWDKVFNNGRSEICGKQTAFKKIELNWSALADRITSSILTTVFHKFYLGRSWILCPIYNSN